jgi:phage FluMu gp28-like protein
MDETIPVLRWSEKPEFTQLPAADRTAKALAWCREHLDPLLSVLQKNLPSFLGEDFGRTGDLTVLWPLQESGTLRFRTPFLAELRNIPYQQQEQVLFYILDALPRFMAAAFDARGNGNYLSEVALQRYGAWRIEQVQLSQPWYLENMPGYKAAYEDRAIIIPKDMDVLDDPRAIKMEKGVAKVPDSYRTKGRDGMQRHGDSGIAGALAWYAATKMDPARSSSNQRAKSAIL